MTTDIQELTNKVEQLQRQLSEQEKMVALGMLSAGIAHEIQNPLNFVINFSKMSVKLLGDLNDILEDVKDKLDPDDAEEVEDITADLTENLNRIQEHGERAISIIRNILLQSRGKDGEFLPTDVTAIVHEYVWLSYHAMRANDKTFNVSIKEDYDQSLPKVMVIPQDVCRAVLNLVNNACYALRERAHNESSDYVPQLSVAVRQQDGNIAIIISDNGTGMPDEVRAKLFREVFTTKPIGQGTGLGLSITHHIVCDEHGGSLLVDTTLGVGTTFTIMLPMKR